MAVFTRTVSIPAFCAFLTLATMHPANATEFCEIAKTRDGFVALRAGASPSAALIARMRPGGEAQLVGDSRGDWQEVIYWQGQTRLTRGYDKPTAKGWVNRKLLRDCG